MVQYNMNKIRVQYTMIQYNMMPSNKIINKQKCKTSGSTKKTPSWSSITLRGEFEVAKLRRL